MTSEQTNNKNEINDVPINALDNSEMQGEPSFESELSPENLKQANINETVKKKSSIDIKEREDGAHKMSNPNSPDNVQLSLIDSLVTSEQTYTSDLKEPDSDVFIDQNFEIKNTADSTYPGETDEHDRILLMEFKEEPEIEKNLLHDKLISNEKEKLSDEEKKELDLDDSNSQSTRPYDSAKDEYDGNDLEKRKEREGLIDQYRRAVLEHKLARETNLQLQTKLAEYFRRKKADAAEQQSATSSIGGSGADVVVDYEQRYNKYIASLTELRHHYQDMQASYQKQIEELKKICQQRQEEVDEAYKEFTDYKFSVGKKALHSRTGRPINPKDLAAMFNAEKKKEAIVMEVRLENIKLRNEVAKVEAILKSKEELADGLHLIDFEQLKIENQTYNEKIEERNEELSKLRRKISNTVQIMSHIKEKLQAVQNDNTQQRQRLGIADAELTFNRDQLTRLKQTRDRLRAENDKLRRSCGLLGKNALLINYENSVDAVESKKLALNETKEAIAAYQLQTQKLVEKIENLQGNKRSNQ